ncbi:hypothetical protein [Flavobacterium sp.]|uniref:hypothetical protein n=1 Tax=Flavobacterium sp. TaxID=239 RepID=UPI002B4B4213|nr:hypothetical protein [Flavobacterium sp.]HLF51524.1 hypothetical protein [Flavobacterium sp.]
MEGTRKSEAVVLKQFFGLLPGQTLVKFQTELKALSPQEKLELASLAAKEMKLTQEQVSFNL